MTSLRDKLDRLKRDHAGRTSYHQESRLGHSSPNPWIRKSAEILGWLHEGEHELLWELAMRPGNGHILEIGSWLGKSTCILTGACIERGDSSRVVTIDTFCMDGSFRQTSYYQLLHRKQHGTFYEFIENAKHFGFSEHVIPIATYSQNTVFLLQHIPFRLAFIDGRHDYDGVRSDIEMVLPLVSPGGVIAIHDVGERYPEIDAAIMDVLNGTNNVSFLTHLHCLAVYQKEAL